MIGTPRNPPPLFSIVVPMLNEAGSVEPLAREIAAACAPLGAFEAIFVNDGSTDATSERIAALRAEFPWLREVRHARPCGQSAALRTGVTAARAAIVCTIDGDGQNPPAEIPKLLAPLLEGRPGLGLVAGQRIGRQDSASKRLASRLANRLRARILHDGTSDSACGLKAFPREVFLALPFFDHMHRYLPALVRREGLAVELVDVAHRARCSGASKYTNTGRAVAGLRDLLGVWWLLHRRRLPQITHSDSTHPEAARENP
ncbi:MAG: glycosyltransferase family 2 protein [Proteobacteria bacterium]|nr:glycosyltransferase family 2 protein [Pseudomonadota bacterium]